MKPTPLMLVNIVLAVALLSSIVLMTASITSANQYDPWTDVNGDGVINIQDAALMGLGWQAAGDPTRNVNVMNWPVSNQQTVFVDQATTADSAFYNASGFGHIHLLWYVSGLVDPEFVNIFVQSRIYNPNGPGYWQFSSQYIHVTPSNYSDVLSIPVPSETFNFRVYFPAGTTATVQFAFYLTFA